MNLPHLHLLLNHWPIIGTFIALGLLIVSLVGKSSDLKQASLALFALTALLAVPSYTSGFAAEAVIRNTQGISARLIQTHQGEALLATILIEITGGIAWFALTQFRSASRARWTVPAIVVCSIVTVGLVTITGNSGGEIRHPEIQSGEGPTSIAGTLGLRLEAGIEHIVTGSSRHVWPVLETLHFLGLTLLLGTIGVLNLRVLGFLKIFPIAPLQRFVPWAVVGLAINIVTGMLFFVGMPYFYIFNADFQLKTMTVVLAGANLLLYSTGAFGDYEQLGPGENAPAFAKLCAASSLILWIVVIGMGRYMPYFEESLTP